MRCLGGHRWAARLPPDKGLPDDGPSRPRFGKWPVRCSTAPFRRIGEGIPNRLPCEKKTARTMGHLPPSSEGPFPGEIPAALAPRILVFRAGGASASRRSDEHGRCAATPRRSSRRAAPPNADKPCTSRRMPTTNLFEAWVAQRCWMQSAAIWPRIQSFSGCALINLEALARALNIGVPRPTRRSSLSPRPPVERCHARNKEDTFGEPDSSGGEAA